MEIQAEATRSKNETATSNSGSLRLTPVWRRHLGAEGSVRPFLRADLRVGYERTDWWRTGSFLDWSSLLTWSLEAMPRLGLGVEWFPLDRLSISGWSGLELSARRTERVEASEDGRYVKLTNEFGLTTVTPELLIRFLF
jgi:hypothetical protein